MMEMIKNMTAKPTKLAVTNNDTKKQGKKLCKKCPHCRVHAHKGGPDMCWELVQNMSKYPAGWVSCLTL